MNNAKPRWEKGLATIREDSIKVSTQQEIQKLKEKIEDLLSRRKFERQTLVDTIRNLRHLTENTYWIYNIKTAEQCDAFIRERVEMRDYMDNMLTRMEGYLTSTKILLNK